MTPGRCARLAGSLLVVLVLLCGTALAGTVRSFHYDSPALGGAEVAEVYLPSGEAPAEGWPVLYLLHGLHGTATDWVTLGGVADTLDRLIASRRIRPMVVVMPRGDSSWYVDSADVGGPGNYAAAIAHDLPKAVEAAFDVDPSPAHRAIAGVSMGGYGALRLGLGEPGRFCAIAALSPAIWQNIPLPAAPGAPPPPAPTYFQKLDPATVTIGVDLPPPGDHFGAAFGTPFDPRRFNAANVFTVLEQAVEAHRGLPPVFLSVGDDDSHGLWRGSIALFETMQMNKLPVEFRVTNGDHTWSLWKVTVADAFQWVDAQFGRVAGR